MIKNPEQVPFVSVVSLAYNRRENVLELMEALREQDYARYQVILVDNDSQDGTADAVESMYRDVQVIRCPQNYGMVAYNFGLAEAKGKYILVMDDDGLPGSKDWMSQVVDRFESNPRLGAVACTIRMRDTGKLAYDSPQFVPTGDPESGFPAAAYNGTGAGLRAAAMHEAGYYPFHFFRSWLELHLCTRLVDAGWEVRHFPSLEVWHSRPSGSVHRPTTYYALRNYLWYVWTFYPWPEVMAETAHYLGFAFKCAVTGQAQSGRLIRGLVDGVVGWRRVSSERKPISQASLSYLRHVRRHGNDHGFAPVQRQFPFG